VAYGVIILNDGLALSSFVNKKYFIPSNNNENILSIIGKINKRSNINSSIFPVLVGNEKIAEIIIGIDNTRLVDLAKKDLINQLKINAFIIFILSIFIYLIFKVNVLEPLRELIKGAQRISEGDLDQKVKVATNDEIGELANVFNCMMGKMNASITAPEESNHMALMEKIMHRRQTRLKAHF